MQNSVSNFINKNIINIKSEMLYREAEDDFFYFYDLNKASEKLKKSIEYTPFHTKSIILLADICFIKGNFDKAVSLYLIANGLKENNAKIMASIANCYNSLKKYELAVKYCDKALENIEADNYSLFSQIIELKIRSLTELKQYDKAYITFNNSRDILKKTLIKSIYSSLNEKIELYKRLKFSGLKII